ncbi:MAG: hypothetical protein ACMXYL_03840 [Candidatus Woesearchaeota archaeon]
MRLNNNILAVIIIVLLIGSLSMNLIIINQDIMTPSGKSIATLDLCINLRPVPTFENCSTDLYVYQPFHCVVNTTDYAESQNHVFFDNSTLFTVGFTTGIISFTPQFEDIGNHSVLIFVDDMSGCENSMGMDIWSFTIHDPGLNDSLQVWPESDEIPIYKYHPIRFYANYTDMMDNNSIQGANCSIEINTTGQYQTPIDMVYNNNLSVYTHTAGGGFLQGDYTFRVTCVGTGQGYGIIREEGNYTITNRPPYVYANFPNITIRQATTLFGYNLNDYFKDEDLDILSFTHFPIPNINIEINPGGDVTFRPDPWFYGNSTTFFTADDSFDTAQGNTFIIIVEQAIASPIPPTPSGAGAGPSGVAMPPCIEDWECAEWGECTPQGYQYRRCIDNNSCYTVEDMPELVQECQYIGTCYDGIKNCHSGSCETGVDCGGPCDPCPTCFDGIQNQGEEGVDCGGPCPPCKPEEPRVEEPRPIITITEETRRRGLTILSILSILGALSVIISLILHRQVMKKLAELPYPKFTGSISHVSSEARTVIAIEMARSDKQATYKQKVTKLSTAFLKLMRVHLGTEEEITLEQARDMARNIGDQKLASRIIALSETLEEAEYKKEGEEDIEKIIDNILVTIHTMIHTKVHQEQIAEAKKSPSKLQHSFIKALLDVSDSLIREKRIYSAAILVRESLIYYKSIRPSRMLKERMEETVREMNSMVQKAREESHG